MTNDTMRLRGNQSRIAMLSIHASPTGKLGEKDTGGMSVYVRELARELGKHGLKVDIFTRLFNGAGNRITMLYKNVRLIHLSVANGRPVSKLALYAYMNDFKRELDAFRIEQEIEYDLIHSNYWLSGCLGQWAQEQWGRPHVVMFHTLGAIKNNTGIGDREPDFRISTERQLIEHAPRILAPTEREKRHLINYYDAPTDRIGVVPCGVNLELFRPVDKVIARRRLGLDSRTSLALYVGRLDPLKGLDQLLKAMTLLKHIQGLRLLVVGGNSHEDPESEEFKRQAGTLGIADKVSFTGRVEQEDLPLYYSAADVLVVPSYYESFGLVGLESLACGTPVITAPVGALDTYVRDGETGNVVSPANPRTLADSIDHMVTKGHAPPPDAIRMSVLNFDWSYVASAVLEEYEVVFGQCHE